MAIPTNSKAILLATFVAFGAYCLQTLAFQTGREASDRLLSSIQEVSSPSFTWPRFPCECHLRLPALPRFDLDASRTNLPISLGFLFGYDIGVISVSFTDMPIQSVPELNHN